MKIEIEIGGRTKVGRALRHLLDVGSSGASEVQPGAWEHARASLASELFRVAWRAGWRPKRADEK